ncbi:MAG: treZ [Chthoniobacteraceae bacterium]|nr:treZ [Chthoniobacteraceae bacterium]
MLGAKIIENGVEYCAWAPGRRLVEVEIEGEPWRRLKLERAPDGYHRILDREGKAGDNYRFLLDGGEGFPDPASRAQAGGVHGASVVVDPDRYQWNDASWARPAFRDLVIYELHIGTFTPEGTFRAAIGKLPHLQRLGVSAIELMPIGDFPGSRNWGYDGVLIYAPARAYGTPDDLRALVDAAHAHGIAVILDVVYNHFGPDGNYIAQYSAAFFNEQVHTPWGAAFNFDGEFSEEVRDFFVQNPIYWMEQFHVDGFRLDATHAISDTSQRHILADITRAVHDRGGYAIAEDERNDARLLTGELEGGHDFDAVWADDFHHAIRVSQTGEQASYFSAYRGTLKEVIETLEHGWLYRGERPQPGTHQRGSECIHLPPSKFIHCISNHDQVGNRALGERISHRISPPGYRAISLLLCLSPYTPMLFMGQEWAASTPFLYFTDHNQELGALITEGRRREFAAFPEFTNRLSLLEIPDPQDEETFHRSKLNWSEVNQREHAKMVALYTEGLRLRRESGAFRPALRENWEAGAMEFGAGALRFESHDGTYLLIFDLRGGHHGSLDTEPLARAVSKWEQVLCSNEKRFGGDGEQSFNAQTQSCSFRDPGAILLKSCR